MGDGGASGGEFTEIVRCDEPAKAHLVAGFLESLGIPAEVVGDQSFWADGSMVPKDMRPTVRVPAADAERARALLAELEAGRSQGAQWLCDTCEDYVPPAFTECPVCGGVRPPRKAG
jgi:hypothetical protein